MAGSTAIYVADISARKKAEIGLAEAKEQLAVHAENMERLVRERTARLEETVRKLEETIVELERFSYTISHDLRAPLRAMQSFAQFLEEDYGTRLDATARDYLGRIRASARHMDQLIQDVLAYARTSREQLHPEAIALDPLFDEVLAQYAPQDAASIHVRHPLGAVQGSRPLLTQVVSNLVGNAVKFVQPGTKPNVEIWSEQADGRRRVFFKDDGVGIPLEAQGKIFGIFEKAHGRTYPGTGIGLAIVKRALERMDGRVAFESKVNRGSTFWIDLPVAKDNR
jgi:signal transduction histidine kinase